MRPCRCQRDGRRDRLHLAQHISCLCGNTGTVGQQGLADLPRPVQVADAALCGEEQLAGADLCAGGERICGGKSQLRQNTGYLFGAAEDTRLTGIERQRTRLIADVQPQSRQIQVRGVLLNEGIQFAVRNIDQIATHL